MRRIRRREWYTRIDDRVILGALPFREMLPTLVEKERVAAVLSMNQEHELDSKFYPSLEDFENAGIVYKNIPVQGG